MDQEQLRQELREIFKNFEDQVRGIMKPTGDKCMELQSKMGALHAQCESDIKKRAENTEARKEELHQELNAVKAKKKENHRLMVEAVQMGDSACEKDFNKKIKELTIQEVELCDKISALKSIPVAAGADMLSELQAAYDEYVAASDIQNNTYKIIWALIENEWEYSLSNLKKDAAYERSGRNNSIEEMLTK